jgi:hypothetical protein
MNTGVLSIATLAGALALAGSAQAKLYSFSMDGTVTQQLAPGPGPCNLCGPIGANVDIHVGDAAHMSLVFAQDRVLKWTGGFTVLLGDTEIVDHAPDGSVVSDVFLPTVPDTGPENYNVTINGLFWDAASEDYNGYDHNTYVVNGPNGHIIDYYTTTPMIGFDASGHYNGLVGRFENMGQVSPMFTSGSTGFFLDNQGDYNDYQNMPRFVGVWDVANAVVSPALAVPEPATWAMMLIGLGALGALARRHRRVARESAAIAITRSSRT